MAGTWGFSSFGFCIFGVILSFSAAISPEGKVKDLHEGNWNEILEGEWMIKFYAPWCPACQYIAPAWSAFALKGKQLGVNVGQVDVAKESALSGKFMVVSLPTFYHIKDGRFCRYDGSRSLDEFEAFVKEEKWRQVDPIPSWKSPGSYVMGALGFLFKLSVFLKNIHDLLTTTYGLPVWASYMVFGVSTVAVGLLLGLIIVCVSDHFFVGPEPVPVPTQTGTGMSEVRPGNKDKDDDNYDNENEENKSDEEGEEKSGDTSIRKRKKQATTD